MTRIIKPIAAATLLGALVIGVPALLITTVGNPFPSQIPSIDEITSTLTQSGQGFTQVLISVLAVFIWLIWAQLIAALGVETAALAARKQSRHLPVLPGIQTLAIRLVAALTITATLTAGPLTGLASAATYAAQPATQQTTRSLAQPGLSQLVETPHAAPVSQPAVKVRTLTLTGSTDLWGLAQTLYGDGAQWRTLIDANTGAVTSTGEPITAELSSLPAQTVIALADHADLAAAVQVGQLDDNEPPDSGAISAIVEKGDTLWSVTETALHQELGRVPRDNEIVDRLAQVIDVNLPTLRSGNPDLIYPGESIELTTPITVWTNETTQPGAGDEEIDLAATIASAEAALEQPTINNETGSVDEAASSSAATATDIDQVDLAATIAAAESGFDEIASSTAVPDSPAAETVVESSIDVVGVPPSGQFFGQFLAGDAPPVPVEGADINIEALPPVPASTLQDRGDTSDATRGWDPPAISTGIDLDAEAEPAATPNVPVPAGEPVQPESNSTVNPEDLASTVDSRTVKSVNWVVLLAAVPLLAGGIWAAMRRRRQLMASRRPSRYAPSDITETETDITEALAGSSAVERAAKVEALSAQIARWIPLNAPKLVAVSIDDTEVAALWDADLAPVPVGEPSTVLVDGSSWRIEVDDLVTATDSNVLHGLPALVHLGRLMSGRDLFVNLEELGRANLIGEPKALEQLCGRLSMELALSPMFNLGTLILVGFGKPMLSIDNIEYYETSPEAHQALASRIESLDQALTGNSALQIRASGQLDSDISPIVIIDLTDTAPHPNLVAAAESVDGGICLVHSGGSDSAWPLTLDQNSLHIGGALEVTVNSSEPNEETITKILAMVATDIEYEPADTIEGAISDSLIDTTPDETDDDVWRGDVVAIDDHHDWSDNDNPDDPDGDDHEVIDLTDNNDDADLDVGVLVADVGELITGTWPDPEPLPSTTGVRLRILGAVTVEGAEFSKKAARYVELVALILAKGGKITLTEISTAMYNGEGNPQAILQLLRRTRKALGDAPNGEPRLSFESSAKQYELQDVSTDFDQIIAICNQIKTDESLNREDACKLMDSAAQLIAGPPYAAAGETYDWIYTTGDASQAVIAADSLCRELGEVYLALGNYPRARWSIRQGLKACPACDELYEALIRITAKDCTRSDLAALWTEIEAAYDAADLEVPQTLAAAYGTAVAA